MTAMGQSRHSNLAPTTSDLPRLADIFRVHRHVSKVPISDIDGTKHCRCQFTTEQERYSCRHGAERRRGRPSRLVMLLVLISF
jgi:hypothetical protein